MSIWRSGRRASGFRSIAGAAIRPVVEFLEDRTLFSTPVFGATIAQENALPGTSQTVWDIPAGNAGDPTLQGFATDISVTPGQNISFKINDTASAPYSISIYRMGYYQGNGARLVTSIASTAVLKQVQPAAVSDPVTGLVDAGNWAVSATWAVPTNALSGIYFADLIRSDTGGMSQIVFVVRNDTSHSAILLKTNDASWVAYNQWGGNSFYTGTSVDGNLGTIVDSGNSNATDGPHARAVEASYNRPLSNRGQQFGFGYNTQVFYGEYPMVRWLEANGYDVSYTTDVDAGGANYAPIIEQHKIFMDSGHDEYWSGTERANAQAARDAGVNLAFFSGNTAYWKTYNINSTVNTDGTDQANRIVVCYKETWANAITDSTNPSVWTGVWGDPRFSPPTDGGPPTNALTGALFGINSTPDSDGESLQVPYADADLRLWRNTSVAALKPGQTATLGQNIIGYEADLNIDNGFQPAGLINLSATPVNSPQVLLDYGSISGPEAVTHNMTLYRAASGALVFNSATVQWAWGLDGEHDETTTTPDPVIEQATVNLFADMGAQPTTLQTGLVAAAALTDRTAPTSTITAPPANATLTSGTPVTITGTAVDSGGGVVAGVEVSTDGGTTWHPATGTASSNPRFATWSYVWTPGVTGSVKLLTRATDDGGNLSAASTAVTVNVTVPTTPLTLFANTVPSTLDNGDAQPTELGLRFTSDISGYVTGIRFYKAAANTGTHIGNLWTTSGTLLASATFTGETASGWQQVTFSSPVAITSGTAYVASYFAPVGHYSASLGAFAGPGISNGALHGLPDTAAGRNGVFAYASGSIFPSRPSLDSANYGVDILFQTLNQLPPQVLAQTPATNSINVAPTAPVSIRFNENVSVSAMSAVFTDAGGHQIPATISYTSTSDTATLTPNSPLLASMAYTISAKGASSGTQVMAPVSWTFTTAPSYSLFSSSATPVLPAANDPGSVELGVRFTSTAAGFISGLRFYKGLGNGGTHVGSLWSATGQLLASATFTNETSSGWQEVNFASSVPVTANTTYFAGYLAPTGHYAADAGYFTSPVNSDPLKAPAGNGYYIYTATSALPTNVTNANYWVDVVMGTNATITPVVSSGNPAANATGVATNTTIAATFNEWVQSATISISISDTHGNTIPATLTSFNDTTFTATFTPTVALQPGTVYAVTVSGATDAAGDVMAAPASWSFTTAASTTAFYSLWSSSASPAVPAAADGGSIEVGVKFRSAVNGFIDGVRFYKGTGNIGTHIGNIWSSTGQLLASGTFNSETSGGWQQLNFANPISVTANTEYIASYFAPSGHYAADNGYFASAGVDNGPLHAYSDSEGLGDGVYTYSAASAFPTSSSGASNYWVDLVFSTPNTNVAPVVSAQTPAPNALNASTTGNITATFNESVQAATISFVLKDSAGNTVPTSLSYDSNTNTAALSPIFPLNGSTKYTATISGAQNIAGLAMSPTTWSFTTAATLTYTLWGPGAVPAVAAANDGGGIEVGVKFVTDVNGTVAGIRFYKGAGNTGTHIGNLWSSTGQLLATATFTGESASGWQTVTFASPVSVTANTQYVASYFAPVGHYSADGAYFASAGVNSGPLHALSNAAGAGDGVYGYGAASTFPSNSYNSTNYWVDVEFSAPSSSGNPTISAQTPAANATQVTTASTVSVTFNQSIVLSTLSFVLTDSSGKAVPATLSYDDSTHTATLAPISPLHGSATYNVTVSGAQGFSGQTMSSVSWSFTTAATLTYTLWGPGAVPAVAAANDGGGIEVGVKFVTDVNGTVAGIRFYKGAGNTGTHIGNLWSSTGQLLATATFTGESASGWQTVTFASPVSVTANTQYVASYFAPVGHYSADGAYFASAGVDSGPLHALSNAAGAGDGVYRYGAASAFPSSSYNSTNYWIDVQFTATTPVVTSHTPASGAINVAGTAVITAAFNESIVPSSLAFVLKDSGGNIVPATVTYSDATHTATLTPTTPLSGAVTYTATVSSAQDSGGSNLAGPVTWSFSTTAGSWQQTTSADFAAGTQNATAVTNTGGGEERLADTFDDFSGSSLSSAWTTTSWTPAGGATTSVVVSGSIVSIAGAEVFSAASSVGTPVEGRVSFAAAPYQHFGLATDFASVSGNYWAIFSTGGTNNTLFARVNSNGTTQDVSLGALPAGFHTYRVQPIAGGFSFYVDGVFQTSINIAFPANTAARAGFSSFGSSAIQADSVSYGNYATTGTFTSAVFNTQVASPAWGTATWTADVPAGTTITVQVSTGNTATPDGTWSAWTTVTNGGTITAPPGRYIQYRVIFTTSSSSLTPVLYDITFGWS